MTLNLQNAKWYHYALIVVVVLLGVEHNLVLQGVPLPAIVVQIATMLAAIVAQMTQSPSVSPELAEYRAMKADLASGRKVLMLSEHTPTSPPQT